jgi:hypothetical protein
MEENAPVVLFVYNRPWHTKQTITALAKNFLAKETSLYIYSDGFKGEKDKEQVLEVRKYIHSISGFNKISIVDRDKNWGLATSVISGVTEVIKQYGKVIVVEDDLVTSQYFLTYMNACLDKFENQANIFSISGYVPPLKSLKTVNGDIFLLPRISSWGWATWFDRWEKVDWDVSDFDEFIKNRSRRKKFNIGGEDLSPMLLNQKMSKINSWAIRFSYASFKEGCLNVYPRYSFVKNIGADGSGTHIRKTNKYKGDLYSGNMHLTLNHLKSKTLNDEFRAFHKLSLIRRGINYYRRLLYILKHDR